MKTDRFELDPDSQETDLESVVKLQFVATRMNEENKYFRKLASCSPRGIFLAYTGGINVWGGSFLAVNHHNHKNCNVKNRQKTSLMFLPVLDLTLDSLTLTTI